MASLCFVESDQLSIEQVFESSYNDHAHGKEMIHVSSYRDFRRFSQFVMSRYQSKKPELCVLLNPIDPMLCIRLNNLLASKEVKPTPYSTGVTEGMLNITVITSNPMIWITPALMTWHYQSVWMANKDGLYCLQSDKELALNFIRDNNYNGLGWLDAYQSGYLKRYLTLLQSFHEDMDVPEFKNEILDVDQMVPHS